MLKFQSSYELPPNLRRAAQFLFLMIVFWVPVTIMKDKSATYDEVSHLPAGYSYLTTGLIKINPQHPPLIKEICAFPLLFLNVKYGLDRKSLESMQLEPTFEWEYGKRFIYGQDADRLVFWGRLPAVLLSLGLATLVMVWAGLLWGGTAGLFAIFLYAFDPTITAHSQLITTDVGLAFFATLFLFILRSHLESPSRKTLVLCGISLGLALGAKFSAVILVPIAFLLVVLNAWHGRGGSSKKQREGNTTMVSFLSSEHRPRQIIAAMCAFGVIVLLAGAVLWVIYIFPSDPLFYLNGLQAVNRDRVPNYMYYLMGELKPGGWKSYFLIAWLTKTPIPSLLLLAASIVIFACGRRASWLDEAFLVIPAMGFFIAYSLEADNLGVRYLIPCFPFLFIFTARIASSLMAAKQTVMAGLAVLLVWYLIEFAAIFPDHLSYFNQFAGGYRYATEWLDDSNVDWGQGLVQLRDYLQKHPDRDFWFCYFGTGDPQYYGIPNQKTHKSIPVSPPPGSMVILSAHWVARGRALLAGDPATRNKNWLANLAPKAIVGHAYYIYEIPFT